MVGGQAKRHNLVCPLSESGFNSRAHFEFFRTCAMVRLSFSSFVWPAVLLVASCRNFRPGVYYVAIPRERIKGPEFEKDDQEAERSCCPHYDRIAPLFFAADGGPPDGWPFGCVSCCLPPPRRTVAAKAPRIQWDATVLSCSQPERGGRPDPPPPAPHLIWFRIRTGGDEVCGLQQRRRNFAPPDRKKTIMPEAKL